MHILIRLHMRENNDISVLEYVVGRKLPFSSSSNNEPIGIITPPITTHDLVERAFPVVFVLGMEATLELGVLYFEFIEALNVPACPEDLVTHSNGAL